jgi:uroporphyrinogen-III synthase
MIRFLLPMDSVASAATPETLGALRRADTVYCPPDAMRRIARLTDPDAGVVVRPEDPASLLDLLRDTAGTSSEGRTRCVAVVLDPPLLQDVRRALNQRGGALPTGLRVLSAVPRGSIALGATVHPDDVATWLSDRPLAGYRVLVTRPARQATDLEAVLRERGAEPVRFPIIKIDPPADPAPIQAAVSRLESYRWVLFTSANGVRAFRERLFEQGLDARSLAGLQVGAIGPATAACLRELGITADVVPPRYVAESMLEALQERDSWSGVPVLLPRAREARDLLPNGLRALGATVDVVEAYRTDPVDAAQGASMRRELESGGVDFVTFTASSTVRAFCQIVGTLGRAQAVAIGPITARTAREQGLEMAGVAAEHTTTGLVAACEDLVVSARA